MLWEILRQAFAALRRNPLRSFLTLLGIAWGIVSVALLVAYGGSLRGIYAGNLQLHRPQRRHRLAGADQRTGRRRASRQGHSLRT